MRRERLQRSPFFCASPVKSSGPGAWLHPVPQRTTERSHYGDGGSKGRCGAARRWPSERDEIINFVIIRHTKALDLSFDYSAISVAMAQKR